MSTRSTRGGVILVAMIFVVAFGIAAAALLTRSLNSYRLAMRNEVEARARAVAQSELETMFFRFRTETLVHGLHTENVPGALTAFADVSSDETDFGFKPTTDREASLEVHRHVDLFNNSGWRVRRSLRVTQNTTGWIPQGQTSIWGNFIYVDVKIEVLPPAGSAWDENTAIRVGREFVTYRYTIFQHAVFYQGDLELYPGANVTVNGDVVANGSIYMGSTGPSITLVGKVSYQLGNYFNSDAGGALQLRKPGTPGAILSVPPIFDPDPLDGLTPDQEAAKAAQLKTMEKPENFIGGVDPVAAAKNPSNLFGAWDTPENLTAAVNSVYRSVIVPPPEAEGEATPEYPTWTPGLADDPVIGAQRVYNRAGLRITVETDGTCRVDEVTSDGTVTDRTSTYLPTSGPKVVTETKNVWDKREGRNVRITEIDVATLKEKLATFSGFNGILYVNLKSGSSDNPAAVRLINGSETPPASGTPDDPVGFAVATNGGLYVKGDYNTAVLGTDSEGHLVHNPAMLMGDAITVLSPGWNDANATGDLSARVADTTGNQDANGDGILDQQIFAGLVTGNVTATAASASGGAQNLVRYLEDWGGSDAGRVVEFHGSLGRLFDSRMFTRQFVQPGGGVDDAGRTKEVYNLPAARNFVFDRDLTRHPPPGSPMTDGASRGRYYYWQR